MKKMFTGKNGIHFSARFLRSTAVAITGLALGFALWTATAPMSMAQAMTPARMIESSLSQGKTMANASKSDLLGAVCAAVKKSPRSAPQIVRVATTARPELAKDILRTAFRCLGSTDCGLLGRTLRGAIAADPNNASSLTDLAIELAPNCSGSFGPGGGSGEDEGNFGNAPGNQNLPPGTIGGGGGQGNVIAICHNGMTIFVSPQGAQNHLNNHRGDTLGPCPVTATQNR